MFARWPDRDGAFVRSRLFGGGRRTPSHRQTWAP